MRQVIVPEQAGRWYSTWKRECSERRVTETCSCCGQPTAWVRLTKDELATEQKRIAADLLAAIAEKMYTKGVRYYHTNKPSYFNGYIRIDVSWTE
jgi:hypothetical protein